METFEIALERVTDPYRIYSYQHGHVYDYGVCGVIEDLADEYMENGDISAAYSYLDMECDGRCVYGCMTITFMRHSTYDRPGVYTFLYERQLNTNG